MQGLPGQFELLLVNDTSTDISWQVIRSLANTRSFIKGVSLRRNVGQNNAIMAGLNSRPCKSPVARINAGYY